MVSGASRRSALARVRVTSFQIAIIVTVLSVLLGLVDLVRPNPRAFPAPRSVEGAVPDADDLAGRGTCGRALRIFPADRTQRDPNWLRHLASGAGASFSILSITNALEGFDKSIEDAAVLCGASPLEAKLRVTLPAISHGIFSAAIFSFLTSWDEVVVAIFMSSPTLQTLPVKIWRRCGRI